MQACKSLGLKTITEIGLIMGKFIKKVKANEEQKDEIEDENQINEIPSREYDYLLSMPLWSLTEERVDDLI